MKQTYANKSVLRKKFLFSFFFLYLSFISPAQEEAKVKYFEIVNDVAVIRTDISGNKQNGDAGLIIPPVHSCFVLIRTLRDDRMVIKFIRWSSNPKNIEQYRKSVIFQMDNEAVKGDEYFSINKTDIDSSCVPIYGRGLKAINFTLGFVTMPVKLRVGKNFDFESTISLGTTAGIKMRMSRHYKNYINFLFGASTSTISLDSFSTHGSVYGQPIKNVFVFSTSFGLVVEFAKSQIGLFYGWDFLGKSNNIKYDWLYNRKAWVSLGFGFSIFSLDDNKSAGSKE